MFLFATLYASEGAPIGLIWWALPAYLRTRQIPLEQITDLMALVVLPWVFKFLWAPLVDQCRSDRWGLKAWIMSSQVLMAVTLIPLLFLDIGVNLDGLKILLVIHALAAATQDVSVDAMAIKVTAMHERGKLNGAMQAGMLLGRSVFGGGALLAVSWIGWTGVFAVLIGWIAVSLLALGVSTEPPDDGTRAQSWRAFGSRFLEAAGTRQLWLGLLFALTAGAAFESAGALAGPYLIDRNLNKETVGAFFGTAVILAMAMGGLMGGRMSDRSGRFRSLVFFLTGLIGVIGLLATAEYFGWTEPIVLLTLMTTMYFFIGLFTAASYALFMDLTRPGLGATQFTLYMAGTNGCEAWSTWAGGRMAAANGYAAGFAGMLTFSALSMTILIGLARSRNRS